MLNTFNWLSVNYLVATAVSASTILWVCLGRLCPRMIKFAPSRTIFLVRPQNGLPMNRSSPDSPSIPSKLIQMLQNKTSRVTVYQFNFTHRSRKWLTFLPILVYCTRLCLAVLSTERKAACACPLDGYFCDFREGGAMCVNQCTGFRCGRHGSCLVDADTKLPKC